MNSTSLIFGLLVISGNLIAQPISISMKKNIQLSKKNSSSIVLSAANAKATSYKTDAVSSRLIAYAGEQWASSIWDKTDSSFFNYSRNRGGDWSGNILPQYDTRTDYVWSSGYWQKQKQGVRTYDASNKIIDETNLVFNAGVWDNDTKSNYTYNSSGKTIEILNQKWISGSWEDNTRNTWLFDTTGNEIQYDEETWDGSDWISSSRHGKTFDANNYLLSDTAFFESGGVLVENELVEYTYDANHNVLTQTSYLWNSGNWDNNYRYTYTYTNNNPITTLYETWISNAWVANYRLTKTFNAAHKPITMLREIFNLGSWANHSKYAYSYDANNNETQSDRQSWVSGAWVNTVRLSHQFDNNSNVLSESQYTWTNNVWSISYKKSWDYNLANQKTTYTYELGNSGTLGNYLREFYYYEGYNDQPNSVTDLQSIKNSCYPNPFIRNTIIDFTLLSDEQLKININDINGRVVHHTEGNYPAGTNSILWQAENIVSGVYFYEIKGSSSYAKGKVAKQ